MRMTSDELSYFVNQDSDVFVHVHKHTYIYSVSTFVMEEVLLRSFHPDATDDIV